VIALFYRLLGDDIVNSYWVSVVLGAASIPLMFRLALDLTADRRVARWSAFFFATSSLILSFAPLVMSEMCSVFLALFGLAIAVRTRSATSASRLVALGTVLGFGLLVRASNVLMIPPIVLYLAWSEGRRFGVRQWVALFGPICGAVGVLMVYNTTVFGSPLRDGYALHAPRTLFAWRFFAVSALPYFRTLVLANGGKTLWLEGPFYGPLIPLLAAVGVVALSRAGRRDFIGIAGVWILSFYLFYAFYFFYDFRFFLPVLPILLLLAACGLGAMLRRATTVQHTIVGSFVVALHIAQPFSGGVSPLAAARRNRSLREAPANYMYVQALNAYMERIGARSETHIVLSALNLVYLDHYSSKHYTIAPLSPHQEYARVPELAPIVASPRIADLLAQGREIYVSEFGADDDDARAALRAIAERYRLEPVAAPDTRLARISGRVE
jgi:4-amino-4-deoxy-L-arabinose transferase-like glycosyltransferase